MIIVKSQIYWRSPTLIDSSWADATWFVPHWRTAVSKVLRRRLLCGRSKAVVGIKNGDPQETTFYTTTDGRLRVRTSLISLKRSCVCRAAAWLDARLHWLLAGLGCCVCWHRSALGKWLFYGSSEDHPLNVFTEKSVSHLRLSIW